MDSIGLDQCLMDWVGLDLADGPLSNSAFNLLRAFVAQHSATCCTSVIGCCTTLQQHATAVQHVAESCATKIRNKLSVVSLRGHFYVTLRVALRCAQ